MEESLPTVPPVTAGIQQQPTDDQLVAQVAAKLTHLPTSNSKQSKIFVIGMVLFLVGCVVGAVAVVMSNKERSLQVSEPPVMVETAVPNEEQASESAAPVVLRTLLEDGSFVGAFDPLGFVLDSQWQDRGLAFDLSYLFYIPDLSVVNSVELDPMIDPSRPLFILQLEVTDSRPTGMSQPIQAHTYLAGRLNAIDYPAPAFHMVEIDPGETKKLFIPLQLPEVTETFLLLSGDQGNPVVTEVQLPPVAVEQPGESLAPDATTSSESAF